MPAERTLEETMMEQIVVGGLLRTKYLHREDVTQKEVPMTTSLPVAEDQNLETRSHRLVAETRTTTITNVTHHDAKQKTGMVMMVDLNLPGAGNPKKNDQDAATTQTIAQTPRTTKPVVGAAKRIAATSLMAAAHESAMTTTTAAISPTGEKPDVDAKRSTIVIATRAGARIQTAKTQTAGPSIGTTMITMTGGRPRRSCS